MKSMRLANRPGCLAMVLAASAASQLQGALVLGTNDQWTTTSPANGKLVVSGDLSVALGFDLGTSVQYPSLVALQIDYTGGSDKAVTSDIIDASGTFRWRDNLGSSTARTKMELDGSNVLKVFNTAGSSTGVSLDGNSGVISLTGSTSGISANGTPVFSLDSSGKINFSTTRPMTVASTVAATSSTTGALIVGGGVGAGSDSYFNSLRVGRGGGNMGANTVVGTSALGANTTGFNNTAMGFEGLKSNVGGYNNSAFGTCALLFNSWGANNSAMGSYAMCFTTSGSNNTALGVSAVQANQTGSGNTGIGYDALFKNQTGSNNVAVGFMAGKYQAGGQDLTVVNNSIFLGSSTTAAANSNTNSIVIGHGAIGEGSNTTVIGNSATTKTHLFGQSHLNSVKVTGTTELEGSVIISQPQGDISMGIYD